MKNKKIWLLISLLLVLLLVVFLVFRLFFLDKSPGISNEDQNNAGAPTFKVEFLNQEEKTRMGISPDLKIQAIKRGPKGELLVYRIIRSEADVVTDLSQVKPISPRAKNQP